MLAEELPENDCPPVRVKLLSERMVAFRDSDGRYGLIDEFCAHRGASLWFGRNEGSGLRCPYHGWKYDVTGQAIEIPSEPENSNFCAHVKLTSYPLVKIGDVLWTYMGDPEKQPPLPGIRVRDGSAGADLHLQALAGMQLAAGVRGRHRLQPRVVPALGRAEDATRCSRAPRATSTTWPTSSRTSRWPSRWRPVRRRAAQRRGGHVLLAHHPWVMPCFTMVPPRGDHPVHGHFWIPIDDENCWAYSFDYHPVRPLTATEVQAMKDGHGVHSENIPGTYRPAANKDNDYLIDREAQKARRHVFGCRRASRCRTPRCRRAWARSSIAPRRCWCRPTAASSRRRQKLKKAVEALRDKGVTPTRCRPRAPPRALRGGRAAAGRIVRRGLSRRPVGARGRSAVVGMSRHEHAGRSLEPAAVARARRRPPRCAFRIDRPIRGRRGAASSDSMTGADAIVDRIARQPWGHARFFSLAGPVAPVTAARNR